MKAQPDGRPLPADNRQLYALLEGAPWLSQAIKISATPLRPDDALIDQLLTEFAAQADGERLRRLTAELGLALRRQGEWRLRPEVRQYFLDRLEQESPQLAQQVHRRVLASLEGGDLPTLDQDQARLVRAYHTTPLDQEAGAYLYWAAYCRARSHNRFAMLSVLAGLAESQAHWLDAHEADLKLYRAAALYYEGSDDSQERAAQHLAAVLAQAQASIPVQVDANFLLGALKERSGRPDRKAAAQLYRRALDLRDKFDLNEQDLDVQRHLRLTLAKSFFNLASALQAGDDPQELETAEDHYRRGLQIVEAEVEPAYEATQIRHLIGVLQRRGEEQKVESFSQRLNQIERPFRQEFLEEALQSSSNLGLLYYSISALNHGLGYELQRINIAIEPDGSARLEGVYTLRAMSMLSEIDTYLKTVPESEAGVHFENVESMTPNFVLGFSREGSPGVERLKINTDPPMQPGAQLTYQWTATATAKTFAVSPQQLEEARLDYEYVSWEIIAPIKQLEIEVVLPVEPTKPPAPAWFDLWRIGRWRATTQAQTAYRAFVEDDPSRVQWQVNLKPPDRLRLHLRVNYPRLAMRYVLAWKVS